MLTSSVIGRPSHRRFLKINKQNHIVQPLLPSNRLKPYSGEWRQILMKPWPSPVPPAAVGRGTSDGPPAVARGTYDKPWPSPEGRTTSRGRHHVPPPAVGRETYDGPPAVARGTYDKPWPSPVPPAAVGRGTSDRPPVTRRPNQ